MSNKVQRLTAALGDRYPKTVRRYGGMAVEVGPQNFADGCR